MDRKVKIEENSLGEKYKEWISDVSSRFKASQIKASIKVNDEMLLFYWLLGRDIEIMKGEMEWGSQVYKKISNDLVKENLRTNLGRKWIKI